MHALSRSRGFCPDASARFPIGGTMGRAVSLPLEGPRPLKDCSVCGRNSPRRVISEKHSGEVVPKQVVPGLQCYQSSPSSARGVSLAGLCNHELRRLYVASASGGGQKKCQK